MIARITSLNRVTVELSGQVRLEAIEIPAGTFRMGSPAGRGEKDERPQREVTISAPFWLGVTPVTWDQWSALMDEAAVDGGNPDTRPFNSWRHPWHDAMHYCARLANVARMKCRLPTEAEWEYACRAGTTTTWPFGDEAQRMSEHAWFKTNSKKRAQAVGGKSPNPWGLHDMLGNVAEWCLDWYAPYPKGPVTDPQGPPSGSYRVLRGGDWSSTADECRSSSRGYESPDYGNLTTGFRVVLVP